MYALSISTGAPFLFTERDMVHIRKWWCISLMERFQIEGHGKRFAHWTSEATALLKGSLEPIYRIPKSRNRKHEVVFPKDDRCFILELSACLLSEILGEVVLLEGDQAYMTLGLVCTTFRDIMSTVGFRRRVHFQWLDSVANWGRFSLSYKEEFYTMYSIETCCECRTLYKKNTPGYVGKGKRGVLQGIHSEDPNPGYCSHFCSQMQ
ncbi:uncharacterized protein V3H82_002572 [Fundulus diaphanus]